MSAGVKRNSDLSEATLTLRRLGEFIEECDERNECGHEYLANGLNIDKGFMPTVANLENVDLNKYKIVRQKRFVFSGMQTGRDECIRIGLFNGDVPVLISPAYTTFEIKEGCEVLPEYIYIQFLRMEMDRRGWFLSDSSIRANLDWNRFIDIEIPVPSIKVQRKVVEAWQGLRRMKEENEKLAEPLMQLCRSYLQDCKKKWPMKELGNYIEQRLEINRDGMYGECDARGVNTNKEIQICKRMGEDLTSYKIVHPFDIVYNANIKLTKETTKFAVGLYAGEHNVIVTNFYTVFSIKQNELLPEYLLLTLSNDEFARYVKFISCSSVRDRFDFSDMCRVKIPLPPIEVQRAIVDVYRCANEAKKIAEEADRLSREICPALVRWAAEGGGA